MSAPQGGGADLAERLRGGMRVAQCVIVLVILLGLSLPNLLVNASAYHPAWAGPAGWSALLAVAVAEAVLIARRRTWGPVRWPVGLGVLGVAIATSAALDPADLGGPAQFTLGVVGWFGVLLCTRIRGLLVFLAAHLAAMTGFLVAAGRTDRITLVTFAITVVGITSFQVAAGMAGAALRSVARTAAAAAEETEQARLAEEIAAAVHEDREARYAAVREVAAPLLVGIGAGTLQPADPEVQRAAAGAAARLRRMFGEAGDGEDPLAAELAELIDIAERRGVDVRYSARGSRPVPPPEAVRGLLAAAGAALQAARSTARVTLAGVPGLVILGVVTDGSPGGAVVAVPDVEVSVVEADGTTWVEARWVPRS